MALWGKKDDIYSAGTITVDYANKTVTGSGTTFTALSVGDVISIGAGVTFGEAVVSAITSDSEISIASTQYLSGADISNVEWTASQKPKYTMHDSNYAASEIFGVSENEVGIARTTEYSVTHGGWVGITSYYDNHGNLRVKHEVLVAMSGITIGTATTTGAGGDAADDKILADAVITITSQPASVGVGTTASATFSVDATVLPSYADLSYQWYFFETGGSVWEEANTGWATGATTNTLTIPNAGVDLGGGVGDLDGYEFRVVVSTPDVNVTSGIATLSVS